MFLSPPNLRFGSIMGLRIIFASPSKWKNLQPWRAAEQNASRVASAYICARELQGACFVVERRDIKIEYVATCLLLCCSCTF